MITQPGEGEQIRGHRVLTELPHIFGDGAWHRVGPGTFVSNPPNAVHGFRPAGTDIRLLNFHTPQVGFIESLRHDP